MNEQFLEALFESGSDVRALPVLLDAVQREWSIQYIAGLCGGIKSLLVSKVQRMERAVIRVAADFNNNRTQTYHFFVEMKDGHIHLIETDTANVMRCSVDEEVYTKAPPRC